MSWLELLEKGKKLKLLLNSCPGVWTGVLAGVKRNSLTYQNILKLNNGETFNYESKLRFYKTFDNLSINIKEVQVTIKATRDKQLVNNKYIPLNINLIDSKFNVNQKVVSIFRKINSFLNRMLNK